MAWLSMSRRRARPAAQGEAPVIPAPSPASVAEARKDLEAYGSGGHDGVRFRLFRQSLRMLETGRLIDLGAGHCMFAVDADRLGWQATALDVRRDRVGSLPDGVLFLEGDVSSDVWDASDYDVVCCLGLYYHLDQEMQHSLLARVSGRPLVLDTHVATTDGSGWFQRSGRLSELVTLGSESGRWYAEAPGLSADDRKRTDLLASYENESSWWPTMPSLLETLRSHGYRDTWVADHGYAGAQRTFLVALPG